MAGTQTAHTQDLETKVLKRFSGKAAFQKSTHEKIRPTKQQKYAELET